MRTVTLAALLAFALAAMPTATGQTAVPRKTVDPGIADGSKQRALSNARKAWKSQGPPSYTYQLTRNCLCPPTKDVRIVVLKGIPSAKTPSRLKGQASVPRLFSTIQKAIVDKAAKLFVNYGKRGVPGAIYIDAGKVTSYSIRNFSPVRR